jgi:hypothetical protein
VCVSLPRHRHRHPAAQPLALHCAYIAQWDKTMTPLPLRMWLQPQNHDSALV